MWTHDDLAYATSMQENDIDILHNSSNAMRPELEPATAYRQNLDGTTEVNSIAEGDGKNLNCQKPPLE